MKEKITLANSLVNGKFKLDDYITITYSEASPIKNKIYTKLLAYNMINKKITNIYQFEYTSQYPLGYYDSISNQVYYTKRNIIGDQIHVVDLKNNNEIQLTKELFAVNYIITDNRKVFFVARPVGQVVKLGVIDLDTNIISYYGDDDSNVEAIVLDRKRKKVFISAYSEKEKEYNLMHQGNDNFKMPKFTVYETDYSFTNTRKLFSKNLWIRTVMINNENVYALCDRKANSGEPSIVYCYNNITQTISKSIWGSYRLQIGDANYSSDGKHIYSISAVDNVRGIYDFNLKTSKVTPIMIQESGCFINNIQFIRI